MSLTCLKMVAENHIKPLNSRLIYPFSAIMGQDDMKLALILNAINPGIGGVLIRGEKGTAKSTTVRALASLLPEIKILSDCPYACDPGDPDLMCDLCRANDLRGIIFGKRVRVVELPLNVTEDMVLGGINLQSALKKGVREFDPGILARANRSILYVDEINLLDDHIVDIILDASASNMNVVEREGISFVHPSSFILVGTMNPEEGGLRPQLLDRFGLCVEVNGEKDIEKRIILMQRREEFDQLSHKFIDDFRHDDEVIAERITNARDILGEVKISEGLELFISELSVQNNVAGHRADIVMRNASIAMAAYEERLEVTIDDIKRIANFALVHRMRDAMPPPPPPPQEHDKHDPEQKSSNPEQKNNPEHGEEQKQDKRPASMENQENMQEEAGGETLDQDIQDTPSDEQDIREEIFEIGTTFKVRRMTQKKDHALRRGSGKRSRTRTAQKQGRYVKSSLCRKYDDIALDATIRAAAPYQARRKKDKNLAICIRDEDIHGKVREKRTGNFLLFIVDASGSMGAKKRMVASKGAILSLLLDAYQKRDKVAMISFCKNEAMINLPPTSSIEFAAKLLKEMPVGGRTPLSAGLLKGYELLRNNFIKYPLSKPFAIIITDGKANVALGDNNPFDEASLIASKIAADDRIKYIVVNTEEQGIVKFGLATKLASALGAEHFSIQDLKAEELVNLVRSSI